MFFTNSCTLKSNIIVCSEPPFDSTALLQNCPCNKILKSESVSWTFKKKIVDDDLREHQYGLQWQLGGGTNCCIHEHIIKTFRSETKYLYTSDPHEMCTECMAIFNLYLTTK
jgi:hypothetical protein